MAELEPDVEVIPVRRREEERNFSMRHYLLGESVTRYMLLLGLMYNLAKFDNAGTRNLFFSLGLMYRMLKG